MKRPLGASAARINTAPFVLVDLETEEGVTGRAHAFCYMDIGAPIMRGILEVAGELIAGATLDPDQIGRLCRGLYHRSLV